MGEVYNLQYTLQHWLLKMNVSWALNQQIGMTSNVSCDTEDWSDDDENAALQSKE